MREIKFKVWDTEEKEFINNCAFEEYQPLNDIFKNNWYVFLQYTGLKDIDNKEIYEGDILRTLEDENNCNFQVIFKDGCFITDIDDEPLSDWSSNSYIVGNIYENPELLD